MEAYKFFECFNSAQMAQEEHAAGNCKIARTIYNVLTRKIKVVLEPDAHRRIDCIIKWYFIYNAITESYKKSFKYYMISFFAFINIYSGLTEDIVPEN